MQIIGENLELYDSEHYPEISDDVSNIDIVKYFMQSYHLHQRDLADILYALGNCV